MARLEHIFYSGFGNTQAVFLNQDGSNIPQATYDTITRVVLTLRNASGDIVVDSNLNATAFDYGSAQKLTLDLGPLDLAVGDYEARLVVYLTGETDGIVWADYKDYTIRVRD